MIIAIYLLIYLFYCIGWAWSPKGSFNSPGALKRVGLICFSKDNVLLLSCGPLWRTRAIRDSACCVILGFSFTISCISMKLKTCASSRPCISLCKYGKNSCVLNTGFSCRSSLCAESSDKQSKQKKPGQIPPAEWTDGHSWVLIKLRLNESIVEIG